MRLALIWAMSRNRVIGRRGELPWRLRDDLRFFKRATLGKPVIMGRKTFESIGGPLAGRTVIVVSRRGLQSAGKPDASIVHATDWEEALAAGQQVCARTGEAECIVAGGAEIYCLALPTAGRIYVTEVDAEVEGDTFFPVFDPSPWQERSVEHFSAGSGNDYAFTIRVLDRSPA